MKKSKKNSLIENIALDMMCTENNMINPKDVVFDDDIIEKIMLLTDLEDTDRDGRTLLINAAACGRKNVIEYLLNKSVDIHAKDKMGVTALHAAVHSGDTDCIELLLKSGAYVNAKDIYGNTPISKINLSTCEKVVNLLLDYDADPNIKNDFGVSVLDVYQAYPHILALLKRE